MASADSIAVNMCHVPRHRRRAMAIQDGDGGDVEKGEADETNMSKKN